MECHVFRHIPGILKALTQSFQSWIFYHNVKDIAEREGPHHLQEVREFQIWSWFCISILDLKLRSFEC